MRRKLSLLLLCAGLSACAGQGGSPVQTIEAPPPGEPAGIVGLRPAQLTGTFGKPSFVRKETAFELWRYDGAACKAFFFLYGESGALAVRHVETAPRGRDIAADLNCLEALKARLS